MWAMVTFLTAFMFLFFLNTSVLTRVFSGVPLAFVVGLFAWCVMDGWEDGWWSSSVIGRGVGLVEGAAGFIKHIHSRLRRPTVSKEPPPNA